MLLSENTAPLTLIRKFTINLPSAQRKENRMKRVLTLSKSDSILSISTKAKHFSGEERGTKKENVNSQSGKLLYVTNTVYLFIYSLMV